VRLAVWTGTRVSELMQVGGRFGIHAQRPGNRLEDFGGGVSVATLLQLDLPSLAQQHRR